MYVKELWRSPVKSMAGEPLTQIHVDELGFTDDRKVMVLGPNRRVVTSRTHPGLLGLKGMIGFDGQPRISGHVWNSPEALALVRETVGPDAELVHYEGPERFDVLPLLVATDGAIAAFDHDDRRRGGFERAILAWEMSAQRRGCDWGTGPARSMRDDHF